MEISGKSIKIQYLNPVSQKNRIQADFCLETNPAVTENAAYIVYEILRLMPV